MLEATEIRLMENSFKLMRHIFLKIYSASWVTIGTNYRRLKAARYYEPNFDHQTRKKTQTVNIF